MHNHLNHVYNARCILTPSPFMSVGFIEMRTRAKLSRERGPLSIANMSALRLGRGTRQVAGRRDSSTSGLQNFRFWAVLET